MKKRYGLLAGIILCMVLQISCVGAAEESLSGELVITADSYMDGYDYIAEEFMKAYPNVSVRIDRPTQEEAMTEGFYQRMKLELMSGDCGDIIASNYFDTESTHLDGIFEDLSVFMEEDPEFDRDDYFSSLFQIFETADGKQYQVMLYGQPVYMRLNRELLDKAGIEYPADKTTFWELQEIYEQVKSKEEGPVYLMDYKTYDPFAGFEYKYYIRNDAFETEEFERYLEANHEMDYTGGIRFHLNMIDEQIPEDALCRETWCISLEAANLINRMFSETETLTGAVLYETAHGDFPLSSYSCFSMSSFSKNKELAWEFLKFAMANHDFTFWDIAAIPVNKQKAEEVYDRAGIDEEVKKKLFSDFDKVNSKGYLDGILGTSINAVLEDYYSYDLISAKECARQLAEKTYLYLNE